MKKIMIKKDRVSDTHGINLSQIDPLHIAPRVGQNKNLKISFFGPNLFITVTTHI